MRITFEQEDTVYIGKDFEELSFIHPEKVAFQIERKNSPVKDTYGIGVMCYSSSEFIENTGVLCCRTETFIESRREAVRRVINFIKTNYYEKSDSTVAGVLLGLIKSLQALDNHRKHYSDKIIDLLDASDCLEAYKQYTKKLIEEVRDNSTKKSTAYELQRYACTLLSITCDRPKDDFLHSSPRISWDSNRAIIPQFTEGEEEVIDTAKDIAICLEVIEAAHEIYVTKNEKFLNQAKWIAITRKNPAGDGLSNFRHIVATALFTFIAFTSANVSPALELRIDEVEDKDVDKELVLLAAKRRAGGKVVEFTVSKKYRKFFYKYLEVRKVISHTDNTFIFPNIGDVGCLDSMDIHTGITATWLRKNFGVSQQLSGRVLRKFYAQQHLDKSGNNHKAVSKRIQNTEPVFLSNYAPKDLKEVADTLSRMLNILYENAIARTRIKVLIPAQIVEWSSAASSIPTGQCLSTDVLRPKLGEGFTTYAPQPDCSKRETCLFCANYGVHADEDDLNRLLSLKHICLTKKNSMQESIFFERIAPVIHRIDEVVDLILNHRPELTGSVNVLIENISMGLLDSFWSDYLDSQDIGSFSMFGREV